MKPTPLKETRLLLNLYPVNSVRLNRIEHLLKMEGKTRTWWINAAVREKLDRDHPETNCPESEYKPAPIPLDNPAAIAAQANMVRVLEEGNKLLAAFTPAALLEDFKTPDISKMNPVKARDALGPKWRALSRKEQEAIALAAEHMASLPSAETIPLDNVNFWGEDAEEVKAFVMGLEQKPVSNSTPDSLPDTYDPVAADRHLSRMMDHMYKILESFTPAAPLAGLPPIPDTSGMTVMEACRAHGEVLDVLNEEEKEAIFEAACALADVSEGEIRPYKKPAPTEPSDSDFWGDDDFAKGRALVKRHTR